MYSRLLSPPPISAPPINNYDGMNGERPREQPQYFFGPDFNGKFCFYFITKCFIISAVFPTPDYQPQQQQSSSQFLNSASGGSSALLGTGEGNSGAGLNVKTNSTDSFLFGNLADDLDLFLNLRPPALQLPPPPALQLPQSAPPFMNMSSSYGSPGNYRSPFGSNYNNTNYLGRSARQHQKPPPPEYYSLKVFLGGISPNLTTSKNGKPN